MAAAAILDNFEWPYLRNGSGSTYIAQLSCSKEDEILIKNLRQLKGYTAIRFIREFRNKNWTRAQRAQILTILK